MDLIKEKILEEIKKEKIQMHSKNYFVVISILVLITTLVSVALVVFMARVIFYSIRVNAPQMFLRNADISHFFSVMPIFAILVFLLGLLVLGFMFKRYELSYKIHYLLFLVFIFISLVAFGFIFDKVDNRQLFGGNQIHRLAMTNGYGQSWIVGFVEKTDNTYSLITPDEQYIKLRVENKSILESLDGQFVRAIGKYEDDYFIVSKVVSREYLKHNLKVKGIRHNKLR